MKTNLPHFTKEAPKPIDQKRVLERRKPAAAPTPNSDLPPPTPPAAPKKDGPAKN